MKRIPELGFASAAIFSKFCPTPKVFCAPAILSANRAAAVSDTKRPFGVFDAYCKTIAVAAAAFATSIAKVIAVEKLPIASLRASLDFISSAISFPE
ncbi:hypothetical protein ELH05_01170 [Rhizobium ruizarguesonis]|uniref:hypothetical protein n=1 Tax=Rhizobium ruizarguesonis TaxID=2081791 RepID=UPI00102F7A3B|nr:hypothetical protein [Rhizobium ruizarguesonis]TBE26571.1 hypothetical protein ELH05_01170 [Rhizobium ruizarguesonis]